MGRFKILFMTSVIPLTIASANPSLFLLDPSKEGVCRALRVDMPSGEETVLFTTKKCPSNIVSDESKKLFYYTEDDQIFSRPLKSPKAQPYKLAHIPNPAHGTQLEIESQTGKPILRYMAPVAETDVIQSEDQGSKKKIYRFEGQNYDASETPSWGLPYMAIALRLDNGKWTRIEAVPTSSDAGETPGLGVLKNIKTQGFTHFTEKIRMTCFSTELDCDQKNSKMKKLLKIKSEDNYGQIDGPGDLQFLFATAFGDSKHAINPLFYCKKDCKKPQRLIDVEHDQLALKLKDAYLLVTEEYSNKGPFVIDAYTGKIIYRNSQATDAIWYPLKP